MFNFLGKSKDAPKIKFDKEWNSYVVVQKSNILYTGTKEQCQMYMKNYSYA